MTSLPVPSFSSPLQTNKNNNWGNFPLPIWEWEDLVNLFFTYYFYIQCSFYRCGTVTLSPVLGMLSHASTFRLGNRSQKRIEKFSFREFKIYMCIFESDSYSLHKYIHIYIYAHFDSKTYLFLPVHIYMYILTCPVNIHKWALGLQPSWLQLWGLSLFWLSFLKLCLHCFLASSSSFRGTLCGSQMDNDVLPGPEMSSGLVRSAFRDVPGNSITKIQCANLQGCLISPSTTRVCPQHLPARPTLIHHKQLLSLSWKVMALKQCYLTSHALSPYFYQRQTPINSFQKATRYPTNAA